MMNRRGFSLVEMVIVLVLAGIVSTAAITMFSTQNQLNAHMTALGESQENARSAVQVAAAELRSGSGGSVATARNDRIVLRMPIVIGVVCGEQGANKAVYVPMNGRTIDISSDVDGYAYRTADGNWATGYRVRQSDGFRNGARQRCIDAGNGQAGDDGDYATVRIVAGIGSAVMMYREVTYYFGPSALYPSRRAFFRARGTEAIELAQGFSQDTHFDYQTSSDTTWYPSVNAAALRHIKAIRLSAQVIGEGTSGTSTGSATFSLMREIQLRNTQ